MDASTRRVTGPRFLFVASLVLALAGTAGAQTVKETSNETRFQFDFKVPDKALAALLPQGFTSDVQSQGPAKDCNLRIIFIDRVTINGPDGKPLGTGTNQLVYLVAPVKDPAGQSAQLVVGGLTADPADAPGPFGNYKLATTHTMHRSVQAPASGRGPVMESQDWVFSAASGEHLEVHLSYERGDMNLRPLNDRKFYSAKDPSLYQISREEQILDILRNLPTNPPDRVKTFSFKGGGGSFASLLDGTEKVLSWDNILWINRTVLAP
jgi:hypothetical protein